MCVGKGCLEVCLCENGADCSHITGACTCTETPGWMGMYCNICKFSRVCCTFQCKIYLIGDNIKINCPN